MTVSEAESLVWALVEETKDEEGERRLSLFRADRLDGSPDALVLIVRGPRRGESQQIIDLFGKMSEKI